MSYRPCPTQNLPLTRVRHPLSNLKDNVPRPVRVRLHVRLLFDDRLNVGNVGPYCPATPHHSKLQNPLPVAALFITNQSVACLAKIE